MTTMKSINATRPIEIVWAKRIETANTQTTRSFARGRGLLAVLATMTGLAALFLVAMMPRWRANAPLEGAARDQRPTVGVVSPEYANTNADLVSPGITEASQETAIYAPTNGYVRHWLVDVGARIKAGQLLAEMETSEIDQDLNQARARREQAAANLELAQVTLTHWQDLLQKDIVSSKEFDEKRAGFKARQRRLRRLARKCKAA